MPKRRRSAKRPYHEPHRPLNLRRATAHRLEPGPGGYMYHVQTIPSGTKSYRCPGCQQLIRPGTAHLVSWTEESMWGVEAGQAERRHWHTACWNARDRRRPFF